MSDPTVYLAGPIQHAADGGKGWRDRVQEVYDDGIEWLDPLAKYDATVDAVIVHNGDPPEDVPEGSDLVSVQELVEADKDLIWEADAVLVGWDDVPSAGTPMEVLFAYQHRKPVAIWYEGDNISPWMEYHADVVSDSLKRCVDYFRWEVVEVERLE